MGSGTTESVRATRGSTTQDGTDAIHVCCAMLFLFSWLDTERLSRRAVITSLVSMRSACAVSRSVIRCVLRVLRSPEHTTTTDALCVSDSAGNVLSTNPKEKLGLEQRSGATDFRSKGYRVSTCSFQQKSVSSLDHCRVLIIHRGIEETLSMFFPQEKREKKN